MYDTASDCTQLELPMRNAIPTNPDEVNPHHIAELYGLLVDRGWMTAAAICRLRPEWDERYVRRVAAASLDILSGPGSPGYKLFDAATDAEVERFAAPSISQGRRMVRRGIGYLRRLKFRRLARTTQK